jgi:hypothetical protein
MTITDILKSGFDAAIVKAAVDAYREILGNYTLQKWKPSELDAGHFVEAIRRALDLELTGSYTAFSKTLPPFDDNALRHYEQQSGHESYRLLIPRALKAIYNIRNKRGVAHISDISPNEMDATFILYTVKWILAELVRLKSGLSVPETQKLIDAIVERQSALIWKEGGITSILVPRMKARDQILVLLYNRSPITDQELQRVVEYSNITNFKKILRTLHNDKLIYYHADGKCRISPQGLTAAEEIIQKYTRSPNKRLKSDAAYHRAA